MRKTKLIVATLICTAVLALAGCGAKKPQTVTVTLPSNPTTGYTWECTQTVPLFDVSSEYTPNDTGDENLVGVGGVDVFTLVPTTPGETQVTFTYGQHWEGGNKGDSVTYMLKVKRNLKVEQQGMTGEFGGDADSLPDMPVLEITD